MQSSAAQATSTRAPWRPRDCIASMAADECPSRMRTRIAASGIDVPGKAQGAARRVKARHEMRLAAWLHPVRRHGERGAVMPPCTLECKAADVAVRIAE